MGYLPLFENDLFISYRHASNEAHDKWIDSFCQELLSRLRYLVGDVTFWRDDPKIRAGDKWRPEIIAALDTAAIFLAIISRTYFDSDVCREELDHFLKRAKDSIPEKGRRIVPIFKHPPKSEEDLPQELNVIHRIEFFKYDSKGSTRFREFSPDKNEKDKNNYYATIERLAQDLMYQLEKLKGETCKHALGKVYLAAVGPELRDDRDKLRADLLQHNYLVVPEHGYFWNASKFRERILSDLDKADLCVHLVSRTASIEPETPERAKLQLKLATEEMKRKKKPPPLVWIQPAEQTDAAARELIDYIEEGLSNEGVEYSQESLDRFKDLMYDNIGVPAQTSNAPLREVALIVEENDLAATGEVNTLLADKLKIEPRRIQFSESTPKDQSLLTKRLAECRQCVVFWGKQSEDWVGHILQIKAIEEHFDKERLCIYAALPLTDDKKTFRTTKACTIRELPGGNEVEFRDFLQRRKRGDGKAY